VNSAAETKKKKTEYIKRGGVSEEGKMLTGEGGFVSERVARARVRRGKTHSLKTFWEKNFWETF